MIVAARIVEIVPIIIVETTRALDGAAPCATVTSHTSNVRPADTTRPVRSSSGRQPAGLERYGARAKVKRERDEHVPRIPLTKALRERIETCERAQQAFDLGRRRSPRSAFERMLTFAPHARAAHRVLERLAGRHRVADAGKRVHVFAELPNRQRDGLAFGAEYVDDPQGSRRVTCEPRLGELLDVEARDIGDGALDIVV